MFTFKTLPPSGQVRLATLLAEIINMATSDL